MRFALLLMGALAPVCSAEQSPRIDADALLAHVRELSADEMEGREAGTPGNARARSYIVEQLGNTAVRPTGESFGIPFEGGVNVVGFLPGTVDSTRVLVLSAHYDHLGTCGGAICNGADDNASGTAGVLALARYFSDNPPSHSMIFALLDSEESGLRGARAFAADPPLALDRIVVNVNLDMVSHAENALYVAGTYHYPFLARYVEDVVPSDPVRLVAGHDRPELGSDDWSLASDHAPFHRAGIPFLYFGVEDHADYHKPTDEFPRINQAFFVSAVESILSVVLELDQHLADFPPR